MDKGHLTLQMYQKHKMIIRENGVVWSKGRVLVGFFRLFQHW
jgi:hypothetical protein